MFTIRAFVSVITGLLFLTLHWAVDQITICLRRNPCPHCLDWVRIIGFQQLGGFGPRDIQIFGL